jgi:c-di-GMP-binding flagellar brake protein YcgR
VQSFDQDQGLISLEIKGQEEQEMGIFAGREATIVGTTPGFDLDLPCVVIEESRFPILVCQKVDRRNYVRVSAFLRLKYRVVERELYEADPDGFLVRIREEMGNGESLFGALAGEVLDEESTDPKLFFLLSEMNRKLDRILANLEKDEDSHSLGTIPVNISGSGIRFPVKERIKAGNLLAIKTVLPLSPPVSMVFLGEVTRVREKGEGEFEIALKYMAIDETDREQIVHYGFKRMRESIRLRKRKRGQT